MFRQIFTSLNHRNNCIAYNFNKHNKYLLINHCYLFPLKGIDPNKFFVHTGAKKDDKDIDLEKKIIFNSFLNNKGFIARKQEEYYRRKFENGVKDTVPISLKYLIKSSTSEDLVKEESKESEESSYVVNLPYKANVVDDILTIKDDSENITEDENVPSSSDRPELISDLPAISLERWMNDYEKYTDKEEIIDAVENEDWRRKYGTPDPKVAVSKVPCGGCGALLHCQDPSIPGYLPSEIYSNCNHIDLREIICQRCHFMKTYNTALSVRVDSDVYPQLISKIKNTKSLVILIADMTDLPCSVWPGILDIIGERRPIILVGNKVDLLWGDKRGWMEHALCSLRSCLPKPAAVKYCSLISSKTGYGIEELITKLHNIWQYKGDVYLVGCTNVGKSTLFNALINSDYCKVKVVDLIQRATTAPWPGTTLNLLKFPILRPDGWRLYLRVLRLQKDRKLRDAEKKLKKEQDAFFNIKLKTKPQLIGHIGRSFFKDPSKVEINANDNFSNGKPQRFGLNPNDPQLAASKWVYDTPGVLHNEQILDLLTTEEITLTLPKEVIEPRTFLIRKGWTVFIGGLARIDYLEGNQSMRLTVFSSRSLPVTITNLTDADEVYKGLLGKSFTVVPRGPPERLAVWEGLEKAKEVSLAGVGKNESCADVTLSSVGWISVTPEANEIVKLACWTPKARGVHVRIPPLLPFAVSLRGKKHEKSPAYRRSKSVIT